MRLRGACSGMGAKWYVWWLRLLRARGEHSVLLFGGQDALHGRRSRRPDRPSGPLRSAAQMQSRPPSLDHQHQA